MLDIVLDRYPHNIALEDGSELLIRPMNSEDSHGLMEFFSKIPASEKIFFQHDVSDPNIIKSWCKNIDFYHVLPLLALDGDTVVANASLAQLQRGWLSHIGNVRAVVDPQYRRKGVARMLIKELIDIALNIGLAKLRAEFMNEQTQAIRVFQTLGFEQAAVINDYAWDLNGEPHDYVMMVAELRGGEYFAAD